jgi:hypothetical protein
MGAEADQVMDGSKQLVIVNQKTNWQIFLIDAFGNNW